MIFGTLNTAWGVKAIVFFKLKILTNTTELNVTLWVKWFHLDPNSQETGTDFSRWDQCQPGIIDAARLPLFCMGHWLLFAMWTAACRELHEFHLVGRPQMSTTEALSFLSWSEWSCKVPNLFYHSGHFSLHQELCVVWGIDPLF